MEKYSFLWWLIYMLLSIWQFPQLLIAILMYPFLGEVKLIKQSKFTFCFEASNMHGGISLGPIAYVDSKIAKIPEIIAHEAEGHVVDSYIMGPSYLIIIGIPSFLHATFKFTSNYYTFYTERLANYHAGLGLNDKGELYFIKDHS